MNFKRGTLPDSGVLMLTLHSLREFDYATKFLAVMQAFGTPRNEKEHEAAKRVLDSMIAALANEQGIDKERGKK